MNNNSITNSNNIPSINYNDFMPSDVHITLTKLSHNGGRRIAVG